MEQLLIVYHGTTRQNATKIKQNGFKPHTWFAKHLEDAVFYGGEYIFEAVFPVNALPDSFLEVEGFQFFTRAWVSPKLIVGHYRLQSTKFYDNAELREEVFISNNNAKEVERDGSRKETLRTRKGPTVNQ